MCLCTNISIIHVELFGGRCLSHWPTDNLAHWLGLSIVCRRSLSFAVVVVDVSRTAKAKQIGESCWPSSPALFCDIFAFLFATTANGKRWKERRFSSNHSFRSCYKNGRWTCWWRLENSNSRAVPELRFFAFCSSVIIWRVNSQTEASWSQRLLCWSATSSSPFAITQRMTHFESFFSLESESGNIAHMELG